MKLLQTANQTVAAGGQGGDINFKSEREVHTVFIWRYQGDIRKIKGVKYAYLIMLQSFLYRKHSRPSTCSFLKINVVP